MVSQRQICILICVGVLCGLSHPLFSEYSLKFDSQYDANLPKHLRSPRWLDKKPLLQTEDKCFINIQGLEYIQASGSGQFSRKSFEAILHSIQAYAERLIVIDLREESHGLINGFPVSWVDDVLSYGNVGLSKNDIEEDENRRLQGLLATKSICVSKQGVLENIAVCDIESERHLVECLGAIYIRLPTTSHTRPKPESVDQFVDTVNQMKESDWLHIHCQAGKGRTTLFLILYDIIKNIHEVSLEEILVRHYWLGGSNILNIYKNSEDKERTEAAIERLQFIRDFARYCQEVPHCEIPWSEWLRTYQQ